ncbi:unnamed protein product [Macrosiphum euphorbiae]|uniref:FHA domain-containing protein n=1 Tax=Macrosiphum euphorbiae TaxID=13131 RepID=A0AAV0VPK3_9HEMI|nr:unnamed protein product [Macrosiphum euphorbiae]
MESTSISPKHAELQCHQDDQALIIRALESTGGPRTLRNCAERSSSAADGGTVGRNGPNGSHDERIEYSMVRRSLCLISYV